MKDVIKSGGYSVYVRELEEAMLAHPAVARAVAFGLPHKEKGEIPVAAVELHAGSAASEIELLDWCRQNLAAYKAPRRIWILEAGGLPQNHNGKLLRQALRERFSSRDGLRPAPVSVPSTGHTATNRLQRRRPSPSREWNRSPVPVHPDGSNGRLRCNHLLHVVADPA